MKKIVLLLCLISGSAFGMGKPLPQEESLQEPQSIENTAVLKEVFEGMGNEIMVVESLVNSQKYGEALKAAKDLLDVVRTRTGINPKAKVRERIMVNGVLSTEDHNKYFYSLSNTQQSEIARAVLNYRGGLYFDILNQTKRASLLYLKAFQKRLAQDGELLDSDKSKIWSDLLEISNIPIVIKDKKAGMELIIFDNYVANSDQQYLFNREIKVWGMSAFGKTEKNYEEQQVLHRNAEVSLFNMRNPAPVPVVVETKSISGEEVRSCAVAAYNNGGVNMQNAMTYCGRHGATVVRCAMRLYNNGGVNFDNAVNFCLK